MTLTELLDRLAELRPDICSKLISLNEDDHSYHIYTNHGVLSFYSVHKWSNHHEESGFLDKLKGTIERAIEAEMQKPDNTWFSYGSGFNRQSKHYAWLRRCDADKPLHNQPNQTIALLACFVEALEQEVA